MDAAWWPSHLDPLRVGLAILIVGGLFVLMHGLGHTWSTTTCNICRLMATGEV